MRHVISIAEFSHNRREEDEKELKAAEEFALENWSSAVDCARNMPRELAIRLIKQIMFDHGITWEEVRI